MILRHNRDSKNENLIQNLPFSDDPHFMEWTPYSILPAQELSSSKDTSLRHAEGLLAQYSGFVDSLKTVIQSRQNEEVKPWTIKGSGVFGIDLNHFINWSALGADVNTTSIVISASLRRQINLIQEEYF